MQSLSQQGAVALTSCREPSRHAVPQQQGAVPLIRCCEPSRHAVSTTAGRCTAHQLLLTPQGMLSPSQQGAAPQKSCWEASRHPAAITAGHRTAYLLPRTLKTCCPRHSGAFPMLRKRAERGETAERGRTAMEETCSRGTGNASKLFSAAFSAVLAVSKAASTSFFCATSSQLKMLFRTKSSSCEVSLEGEATPGR